MADPSKNFWGGHAIVGSHLPIAAGLALGDLYKKKDSVTICMFGEGATNIGYFHEALNLSKVWNLQVLWVCENNKYGMGTQVNKASAVTEIRQKAEGYGIPNERVDGMDIMAVRKSSIEALMQVRSGKGPYLLEIMTYRFRGHSMGDPERYRTNDEIKKWEEDDPIGNFRKYLMREKISTEKQLLEIENKAEDDVAESVRFAENSPEPKIEELFKNTYFTD